MRTKAIEQYIYQEIVPRYSAFDDAHKEDHALTVIQQALNLLESSDRADEIDRNILMMAAACHDLGLINGRDNHHTDSGTIIRSDTRLREWFSEEAIEIIAQAAEITELPARIPHAPFME